MISSSQHGFVKGRSTVTNLMSVTQHISNGLDLRKQTDVIYMDFSKAFDRLDHGILLQKLSTFGLSHQLLQLFVSYLQNRQQYVFYKGFKSVEYTATSGVPQGSILGPLLFNVFINDIIDVIDVNCLLYADDLKIFTYISSVDDCEKLSLSLMNVQKWCTENRLYLNITKCQVMSFSLKPNLLFYDYKIDETILHRPDIFVDLGVTFDSQLSFVPHINNAVTVALKAYGFIVRSSREFANLPTLKTLYFAFVRTKLEYAAVVWSPGYQLHIDRLESVQRKFLKLLSFRTDNVYPIQGIPEGDLLERHNFQSLYSRRRSNAVICLFKLIHGQFDCCDLLQQLCFCLPRASSRSEGTFYLPTARTNVLKFSPLYVMCNLCNEFGGKLDIFSCKINNIKALVS
jgi:Reverse transcriptase (RNA-dependent DNA polymerase)